MLEKIRQIQLSIIVKLGFFTGILFTFDGLELRHFSTGMQSRVPLGNTCNFPHKMACVTATFIYVHSYINITR